MRPRVTAPVRLRVGRSVTRRLAAAPLLAALLAPGAGTDPSPPPIGPKPVPVLSADVDRIVADPHISESSGLAVSPQHDGLLWTINDSGNPPVVYGIDADGTTRARLRLDDVPNVDWEALAVWRDGDGRALMAVADIGDNGAVREEIEVDVCAEPDRLDDEEVEVAPLRRIRLRYPDQAKDAESLLVDPRTQRMYVVAKGLLRARIYLVPESVWPGTSSEVATLEYVGGLGLQLATDGAVLASGHVVLRNYTSAMLLAPLPAGQRPLTPLALVGLPQQSQGEGLAVSGEDLYLSSEGRDRPVLRAALPETFRMAIAGAASASPATGSPVASPSGPVAGPRTSGPGTTGALAGGAGGRDAGTDRVGTVGLTSVALLGLGLVLGLGLGIGVLLRRRRGGAGVGGV